nr:DUF3221 domain-containing protein [Paenibacillus sp. MER 99-2]
MSCVIIGCGINTVNNETHNEVNPNENFEAIVLEKEGSTITVITSDDAKQQYILATTGIRFTAEIGDKVRVWTTGMYEESNPIQGEATNIEKVQ